jgi:hypothetical protein
MSEREYTSAAESRINYVRSQAQRNDYASTQGPLDAQLCFCHRIDGKGERDILPSLSQR